MLGHQADTLFSVLLRAHFLSPKMWLITVRCLIVSFFPSRSRFHSISHFHLRFCSNFYFHKRFRLVRFDSVHDIVHQMMNCLPSKYFRVFHCHISWQLMMILLLFFSGMTIFFCFFVCIYICAFAADTKHKGCEHQQHLGRQTYTKQEKNKEKSTNSYADLFKMKYFVKETSIST